MMITLNLKGVLKPVQAGLRDLEITKAEVVPSGMPSELKLYMKDVEDGATLINSYKFNNSTSVWLMGLMLNIALGLEDGDNFDTKDVNKLEGIVLRCEVAHTQVDDKTYANIKKIVEKVDTDAKMTKLAEDVATTLYSRSDLETEDEDLD